jgi:hypothetical protein
MRRKRSQSLEEGDTESFLRILAITAITGVTAIAYVSGLSSPYMALSRCGLWIRHPPANIPEQSPHGKENVLHFCRESDKGWLITMLGINQKNTLIN